MNRKHLIPCVWNNRSTKDGPSSGPIVSPIDFGVCLVDTETGEQYSIEGVFGCEFMSDMHKNDTHLVLKFSAFRICTPDSIEKK